MDLVKRLEEYRERERSLSWEGTFAQYFEIATRQPSVAQLSHERIYSMIMADGAETNRLGEPQYKFFDQEIFGIEKSLQQIVEYFRSAAQRLEVRQIVVAIPNKNIDLRNILHLSTCGFDHCLEVAQDLLVLGYQVARCGNASLGIAASLPG